MNSPTKNESIQEPLKLIRYTLQSCISIYGPLKPEQSSGYVQMMQQEMMMKHMTFEEFQMYFTLLQALKIIDSVTA